MRTRRPGGWFTASKSQNPDRMVLVLVLWYWCNVFIIINANFVLLPVLLCSVSKIQAELRIGQADFYHYSG